MKCFTYFGVFKFQIEFKGITRHSFINSNIVLLKRSINQGNWNKKELVNLPIPHIDFLLERYRI